VNPNISTAFETAIQRAMAREPSERFPTTRHLGRALLPFASERVRCNYVEELRDGPRSSAERPVPTPIRTPDLGTTIREPDDERNGSRWVARRRKLALPIASAALVLGIAGVVAYELVAPEPGANRHEPTPATVPAPLPR
jgi:hypothetical protein